MKKVITKHSQKLRFGIVGLGLTVFDFGVLFLLVHGGLNELIANYVSTSISFVLSFFINRTFTFKQTEKGSGQQFSKFIIVTIFGLWVLQPVAMSVVIQALSDLNIAPSPTLLAAKLIATGVSMIWNYLMYSRFVFKKTS